MGPEWAELGGPANHNFIKHKPSHGEKLIENKLHLLVL